VADTARARFALVRCLIYHRDHQCDARVGILIRHAVVRRKQTGGADDVVDICIKCGQAINDPEFITSASVISTVLQPLDRSLNSLALIKSQGKYHEGCFFCAACGILIEPEQGHVNDNGQPYHKECHLVQHAMLRLSCSLA